ncbi:MAG: prepilin peptidase [bacterium]
MYEFFLLNKPFLLVVIFILGTIIGSFLNVVIYRINTGRGFGGRSMCFSCNRTLTPVELVPIFSFLFQKARCAKCKTKLSWQYPTIELLTGVLFVLSFLGVLDLLPSTDISLIFNILFGWLVMSILVVITVYDVKHKIIPDQCSYLFAFVTFLRVFILFGQNGGVGLILPKMGVLFAGPILALPFYLIWLVSSGRWMGLGDAKLALGLGWFAAVYAPTFSPLTSNIAIFLYAFWTGTIFFMLISLLGWLLRGLVYIKLLKKSHALPIMGIKSEIPFAPFLILGLLIVFLFRYNIASLIFDNYFI